MTVRNESMYMVNGYVEVEVEVIRSNGSILCSLNSNYTNSLHSNFHSDLTITHGDHAVLVFWRIDEMTL